MAPVTCPTCQASLPVPAELIGRTIRCGQCQTEFEAVATPRQRVTPGPPAAPRYFRRHEECDREIAREKAGIVGFWMMLAGALYCLVGLGGALLAALAIVTPAEGSAPQALEISSDELLVVISVGLALAFLCLPGGPLVLYGGYKLRSLRGAGWVKTSVIASLVLGCVALLLCMIVGVPFVLLGVWGLVTLKDPDVKTALAQADADPAAV